METQQHLWQHFAIHNNLSDKQLQQFQHYYDLLIAANELFNITAITDLESVLAYHFEDSIKLREFVDFSHIASMCDIGTGGGFPGIPLKILYPHLRVTLLEVSQKKCAFLQDVIQKLGLEAIETCDLDWRTFLRKQARLATDYSIDLFCSRASLHPDELIRMFAGSSAYKESKLVYWASQDWKPAPREQKYLKASHEYHVGDRSPAGRKRKYCIFSA